MTATLNTAVDARVAVDEEAVESPPEASLIPLAVILDEVGDLGITTLDQFAAHVGDDNVITVAGLVRCVSRDIVRRLAGDLEQLRAAREEI